MRSLTVLLGLVAILAAQLTAQIVLTTNPVASSGGSTSKNVVRGASGQLYCLSVFDDGSGNRPLLLQASTDGGQTWSNDPFTFNDPTSGLTGPSINNPTTVCTLAIDSAGTLHAGWGRYYYPSYFRQYYRNYNPATSTASAIVDLTAVYGLTVSARTDAMDLTVDAADTVWITAQTGSSWVSKLLRSDQPSAANLAFTNVGNISPTASSQAPVIVADSQGRIHCSFYRNIGPGEYHHRIYDPVSGWGTAVSIGNGSTAPHDYSGKLAADSLGNVHALVGVDTGTPAATWSFEYRRWDSVSGWSAPTVLFTAAPAQYTNIANYQIIALACDEATGKAYATYRDLSAGGVLRLAEKGLNDPAFTVLQDLAPAVTGVHEYYAPTMRGTLDPPFNMTGTNLDITWNNRPLGTQPFSLLFQRVSVGVPAVSLTLTAPAAIGTVATLDLLSAGDPNGSYICGFALSTVPGIPVGNATIPLNYDALLILSLTPGNGIFINNLGTLSPTGQATVLIAVPNFPPLIGLTFHSAFIVADSGSSTGIGTISPALPITIQ